jgi:CHAT domain-containing protein
MYAMQQIPHEFHLAIQIWSLNMHAAEDLLAVAEALKSRVLLDELNGCWSEPQTLEDENISFPEPEALLTGEEEERSEDEFEDNATLRDLSHSQIFELKHKVSSFPIGRPWSEMESVYRQDIVFRKLYEETSAETLRHDLESASREGGLHGSAKPVPLSEIRSALQDGELLIEFIIPREPANPNKECWITATNRDGTSSRCLYIDNTPIFQYIGEVLIERGPISDRAAEIRGAIQDQDDDKARAGLRELFSYLILPVIEMNHNPEDYQRWIIVSHGPLHLVPIHALVDDKGRYLIERVPVTTAPSASVWFHMRHKQSTPVERALLIGNPFLAPELGFYDLPDAAEEVLAIRSLLESTVICTVFIEREATEDRVKTEMPLAGIVHFATHGELDLLEPLGGHRIVLSSVAREDGMLHAREIRRMDLSGVRLVVLNICDGAVCRYSSGDEPLGLLAAMIAGGAENILGGLWELPDDSARAFMVDFYERLLGADPAVALQGAARQAIRDKRSLLEWAGYQLIGPARQLF